MKHKQLAEPVAVRYDFDGYGYMYMDAGSGSDWASRVKNCEFLYTSPQKYCPSENNEAYEKGFIDGMAKQRDSAVQRFVEGGTPDSELAEHKRIIREQQAKEIEELKEDLKNRNINIEYLKEKLIASIDNIKTLKAELEDWTCQGGHSEAYLKVKGKK